jgi:hypothetical protein
MWADGRRCAIDLIAQDANDARLLDMNFASLDAWATTSGLTRAELARIQPAYPVDAETLAAFERSYLYTMEVIWMIGILGVSSILANTLGLLQRITPRLMMGLGLVSGVILLFLSSSANNLNLYGFYVDTEPERLIYLRQGQVLQVYSNVAQVIGLLAIGAASFRIWRRRNKAV